MDMLLVFSLADYQSFEPDKWGIPSVSESSVPARVNCLEEGEPGLDLMVMPGVAFDEGFRRLGHGKGYYDYFLARYMQVSSGDEVKGGGRMPILGVLPSLLYYGQSSTLTLQSCTGSERASLS